MGLNVLLVDRLTSRCARTVPLTPRLQTSREGGGEKQYRSVTVKSGDCIRIKTVPFPGELALQESPELKLYDD